MKIRYGLFLSLFLLASTAKSEVLCPTLAELRKVIAEPGHSIEAYPISNIKPTNGNNPWSIKPIEFKLHDHTWKLGVGPLDVNSARDAVDSASQFLAKSPLLLEKALSEVSYSHLWCYYTQKKNRPMVFAITPMGTM